MDAPEKLKVARPILKLDEAVINRIAAEEVVHRPATALKELIENSLDAGSTNIQILIKEGGLKLLQIQDNGHGIRREDMAIVCERFTTSKLKNFEDLSNISTYGFRGEALASITHVAHVTITTKTADSNCAYRACYSDGKLVPPKPGASAEPKPCAGNTGTQITVEELFYNALTRRKAMKNSSEEYHKILDIVNRYAIHNSGVSFTCKKHGSTQADVNTLSTASKLDNIRQIYGGTTASELLEINREDQKLEFEIHGYISNANYHIKKMIFLLFINHRAVENSSLKKTIENIFSTYLPKQTHPFVYLSLEINPRNVDVNVHPAKTEVHFLSETEIIAKIGDFIQEVLAETNSSRTFLTQNVLSETSFSENDVRNYPNIIHPCRKKSVRSYNRVRTDSRARTLDNFCTDHDVVATPAKRAKNGLNVGTESSEHSDLLEQATTDSDKRMNSDNTRFASKPKRKRVEVQLTSILTLRKKVRENGHTGLTELLVDHTLVGFVDDLQTLVLVQYRTKLYLLNYNILCEELFYQLTLQEFLNFGYIRLSSPAPIYDLLIFALEELENVGSLQNLKPKKEIAQIITEQLVQRKEMLLEYFSMTITETGELTTLPLIIKGYAPNLDKLPSFLLRLGTEVDWSTEMACFDSVARELGAFYAPEPPNFDYDEKEQIDDPMDISEDGNGLTSTDVPDTSKRKIPEKESCHSTKLTPLQQRAALAKYRWQVEHLIFPALKTNFIPPKDHAENGKIVQIANLPDLYRIFERC